MTSRSKAVSENSPARMLESCFSLAFLNVCPKLVFDVDTADVDTQPSFQS
jgi:hypothetical protein